MVMAADETMQDQDSVVPLDEVLGEAEAKFGPMPTCIRHILVPSQTAETVEEPIPDSFRDSVELQPDLCTDSERGSAVGLNLSNETDEEGVQFRDGGEGGISLDDIALVPSSTNDTDADGIDRDDSQSAADTIFLNLEDDREDSARRSPDSGCSMSEVSAEDKISIASTVSSSDDFGASRLDKQIQRLKQAMTELREQDVALARQLLTVYDYVEETKWFLENFEACDPRPRHSIMGPMTPSERRFSHNMQKRMSDFGITSIKGLAGTGFSTPPAWTAMNVAASKRHSRNVSDGHINVEQLRRIYHENNNNNNNNNNNSGLVDDQRHDGIGCEPSGMDKIAPDGSPRAAVTHTGSDERHRSMTRRSISASCLEIRLSSTPEFEFHTPNLLSPIADSGKSTPDASDEDRQALPLPHGEKIDDNNTTANIHGSHKNPPSPIPDLGKNIPDVSDGNLQMLPLPHDENRDNINSTTNSHYNHHNSPSPVTDAGKAIPGMSDEDRQSSPLPNDEKMDDGSTTNNSDERTNDDDTIMIIADTSEQMTMRLDATPDHHRGDASSSSSSSFQSCTSPSSTDSCNVNVVHASPITSDPNNLPLTSTPDSFDPAADDCSIFTVDDSDDDSHDDVPTTPLISHINWLQGQDGTLL